MAALAALYGLPVRPNRRELVHQCTGRNPDQLPSGGFDEALFLTGRRSGKSRIAGIVAAYEAALAGHERKLSVGERGIVPVVAPTVRQAHIVKDNVRAVFDGTPMLGAEVVRETTQGFELRNGVRIEVLAGDYRTIRGFTLLAAIIDEVCFFGVFEECRIKSDTELIRAIRPGLSTVGGRLIAISSPYAPRGWAFNTAKRDWGSDAGATLVWRCPSRTMNPTLSPKVVERALALDPASARSEYLAQWRDDVATFLSRDVIEQAVVPDRRELVPHTSLSYCGFVDMSGGRGDSATLAIAHRDGTRVILDVLREWRPPFNPDAVIRQMADVLRKFHLRRVTGDNFAAEYTVSGFARYGITYVRANKNKSELYLELLPRTGAGEVELLDNERMVDQLASLERRTHSGGRDIVDHPQGGHDDLANVAAGVCAVTGARKPTIGAISL
ncbi:MAG: hypothetical protein ACOC95_06660 [Planctomycetota bacterium]